MKTASEHPPTAESSRPCDEDEEEYNHFGGFFCNIKTKIWFFLFVQMSSVLHILSQSLYKVLSLLFKKSTKAFALVRPHPQINSSWVGSMRTWFFGFKLHVPYDVLIGMFQAFLAFIYKVFDYKITSDTVWIFNTLKLVSS